LLEDSQVIALECIFGELLQGAKTRRERTIITDYWRSLPKIDEPGLWVKAGHFAGERRLFAKGVGLIDVFIVKAAEFSGARVWTLDKRMMSVLPREMFLNKS